MARRKTYTKRNPVKSLQGQFTGPSRTKLNNLVEVMKDFFQTLLIRQVFKESSREHGNTRKIHPSFIYEENLDRLIKLYEDY